MKHQNKTFTIKALSRDMITNEKLHFTRDALGSKKADGSDGFQNGCDRETRPKNVKGV
jgi:hypothetical protein